MRFDRSESPGYINGGNGWTKADAIEFLSDHKLDDFESVSMDDAFIRYKRYDAGRYIDTKGIDDGVAIIRCEKSSE